MKNSLQILRDYNTHGNKIYKILDGNFLPEEKYPL